MFPYIPNTDSERETMLRTLGLPDTGSLFASIPDDLKLEGGLDLPKGLSELEVSQKLKALSKKNMHDLTCFLGAGAYDHYIPSIVPYLLGRSEFYTAYTPYQPEVSQGTLQSVFEYQSMICMLTGMDAASISMYDVSTAMAEAAVMAMDTTKRKKVIVSQTVNPQSRKLLKTYAHYQGYTVVEANEAEGVTDIGCLKSLIDKDTAAVILQSPNFFGVIEDFTEVESLIHANNALFVLSVDPISLGVLKSPGEWGADIAVGDCQCFGGSLSFGGPYLGFLNATKKYMRKMPGRIVGETRDADGNRGFVLTLQTREQHIRREKASSNICSDQTLLATGAAVYLATIGKNGIREIGEQCIKKSHYAYKSLLASGKYKAVFNQPFFKEFVISSEFCPDRISDELLQKDILCGYKLENDYSQYPNALMFCVTEKKGKQEIDMLVQAMEAIQ